MNKSDDDLDEWVKVLQGDLSAGDPMTTALREAIRAEREAEEMRLQPEMKLAEQRFLTRLRREGLLDEIIMSDIEATAGSSPKLFDVLKQHIPKRPFVPIAAAASVLLVIGMGVINFGDYNSAVHEEIIVRGETTPVLVVENPQVYAENLVHQLEMLGAKIRVVPINEDELLLRISLPEDAKENAILDLLKANGIKPESQAPYRITIKKK